MHVRAAFLGCGCTLQKARRHAVVRAELQEVRKLSRHPHLLQDFQLRQRRGVAASGAFQVFAVSRSLAGFGRSGDHGTAVCRCRPRR
jgi:hypothetical protein